MTSLENFPEIRIERFKRLAIKWLVLLSRLIGVGRDHGDPLVRIDLAMLGWAHVVSGLSCWGSVTSDVVGSGWTQVTLLRAVGVGSPGRASLTPLSGGGRGPSRILFFVILLPRSGVS